MEDRVYSQKERRSELFERRLMGTERGASIQNAVRKRRWMKALESIGVAGVEARLKQNEGDSQRSFRHR